MAKTITQFNIFGEPEKKRVRKTRKDKKTPEQKAADKAERGQKKKLEKEKEWEKKWAERGVKQGELFTDECIDRAVSKAINEGLRRIISEAFDSPKLARLSRAHGGLKSTSGYQASSLTDDEIGDIIPDGIKPRQYTIGFNDGTRVALNLTPEHMRIWQKGTPEIERRFREHNGTTPDHHVRNYDWSNYDAQSVFMSGKNTGHIAPSYKEKTPMNKMRRDGGTFVDDRANWRQEFPKDKSVRPYNYNASRHEDALIQYRTKGMTDQEKKDFIINMIGQDRVLDMR